LKPVNIQLQSVTPIGGGQEEVPFEVSVADALISSGGQVNFGTTKKVNGEKLPSSIRIRDVVQSTHPGGTPGVDRLVYSSEAFALQDWRASGSFCLVGTPGAWWPEGFDPPVAASRFLELDGFDNVLNPETSGEMSLCPAVAGAVAMIE
jgi:hypothetical protein